MGGLQVKNLCQKNGRFYYRRKVAGRTFTFACRRRGTLGTLRRIRKRQAGRRGPSPPKALWRPL
jgi:hypothetical protein